MNEVKQRSMELFIKKAEIPDLTTNEEFEAKLNTEWNNHEAKINGIKQKADNMTSRDIIHVSKEFDSDLHHEKFVSAKTITQTTHNIR